MPPPSCACRQSSTCGRGKSVLFRRLALVLAAVSWIFSVAAVSTCKFLKVQHTSSKVSSGVGLFAAEFSTDGRCLRYSKDAVGAMDSAFLAGRAFGVLAVLTGSFGLIAALWTVLFVENSDRSRVVWWSARVSIAAAALWQVLAFSVYGTASCSAAGAKCTLHAGGALCLLAVLEWTAAAALAFLSDPPDGPLLVVRLARREGSGAAESGAGKARGASAAAAAQVAPQEAGGVDPEERAAAAEPSEGEAPRTFIPLPAQSSQWQGRQAPSDPRLAPTGGVPSAPAPVLNQDGTISVPEDLASSAHDSVPNECGEEPDVGLDSGSNMRPASSMRTSVGTEDQVRNGEDDIEAGSGCQSASASAAQAAGISAFPAHSGGGVELGQRQTKRVRRIMNPDGSITVVEEILEGV